MDRHTETETGRIQIYLIRVNVSRIGIHNIGHVNLSVEVPHTRHTYMTPIRYEWSVVAMPSYLYRPHSVARHRPAKLA